MSTQAAPFTPTPLQVATVAALAALSRPLQWEVDAAPLDAEASDPCENDRAGAHGPGTIVGGPCDGVCLACAVLALMDDARRDPTLLTPRTVSLDVLRETLSLRLRGDDE